MEITTGSRLGPYEIVSRIGAGGMGEVFKARDTRLNRSVAIKVLAADLAGNAQLNARLDREARAISQLNHPHICTLHDVGHEEGTSYLVMELLEGESLADRLARGPLAISDVFRYGAQIAGALDRAHRAGIVHRDLKPGNVMITKSGVKLLDFGLAKQAVIDLGADGATQQRALTAEGSIIGTFQYMAPEQLDGGEADRRSDIFALGLVLYEMTTGRRAFDAKTRATLIAAIVSSPPPPISQVRPEAPPALEHVIERCLEKDPDRRWQSASDVAAELEWISSSREPAVEPRRRSLLWLAALIAVLATGALSWVLLRTSRERPQIVQSSLLPPSRMKFAFDVAGAPAISPDGRSIVFAAQPSAGGAHLLFLRALSSTTAQQLAGTESATFPFWSPDSRSLAFFANGKLNRIDVSGGGAQVICDAPSGRGGTWSQDGVIVFAPTAFGGLSKVPDGGGAPVAVTRLDVAHGETDHRFPAFLPDGKRFLYLSRRFAARAEDPTPVNFGGTIEVGSTDGTLRKVLLRMSSNAMYSPPGHLVYWRDRSLVAQRFDPRTMILSADTVPLAERVLRSGRWDAAFSISASGTLAYEEDSDRELSNLVWFDASGKQLGVLGGPAEYMFPKFSHDGKRLAVAIADPATGRTDIWIRDLMRDSLSRLTFDPHDEWTPVWSPDDSRILYGSDARGGGDIMMKRSSGTGAEEVVLASQSFKVASDWSPDGTTILFQQENTIAGTDWDLYFYRPDEHKAVPFLQTRFFEIGGSFSPDGRFVSYFSDESGKPEVYVQPVSQSGAKWQISTAGGTRPRWARDGRRIYFLSLDWKLMAVDISAVGDRLTAGIPRVIMQVDMKRYVGAPFDVSADGRFLVNVPANQDPPPPLTLVQNWTAALKR